MYIKEISEYRMLINDIKLELAEIGMLDMVKWINSRVQEIEDNINE